MVNLANLFGIPSLPAPASEWTWSDSTASKLNDTDVNSEVYGFCNHTPSAYADARIDFSIPRLLKQMDFIIQAPAGVGYGITAYYNSAVQSIGSGNCDNTKQTLVFTSTGKTWETKEVLWVRIVLGPFTVGQVGHWYEIRLWGSPYLDSKLRYQTTSGIKKIAKIADATTSSLKAKTQDGIINIPLVATNDSEASGLHIRKGGTTYAIAEYK